MLVNFIVTLVVDVVETVDIGELVGRVDEGVDTKKIGFDKVGPSEFI